MHVVTGEEMSRIDRFTIEEIGLKDELLMENAGQAVAREVLTSIDQNDRIAVLIGVGNNGGDGFVIARVLKNKGYHVDVWVIPEKERIRGAAKYHMNVYQRTGYELKSYLLDKQSFGDQLPNYIVIIDSLLGTGMSGPLRTPYKEIVQQVNQTNALTISVDLPSGLPADGNMMFTEAIKATKTVTLQCPKVGAFTYPSENYYGELSIVDIGIPEIAIETVSNSRKLWLTKDVKSTFPKRESNSHKGTYGRGLIIGGALTMTGAPVLSAKACHRSGAGLVTVAVPDVIHHIVASQVTEATFLPCSSEDGEFAKTVSLEGLLQKQRFTSIAIGPGYGRNEEGKKLIVEAVEQYPNPLIIDADGLYHLKGSLESLKKRQAVTVLTPHSGEMANLTGRTVQEIEQHRFSVAKDFAVEHGVYLVLKGPFTILTTPKGDQFVNATGNPALAKGGSGDVLTGMILAFIMQHSHIQEAISNAIFLHGKVADTLIESQFSACGVIASDIVNAIPHVLKEFI
ncbi:NAD(P)H-hydrate dehydratase [Anaerobacillus sp. MEB173]|uniref:NAD(P)H-hydrate dehydratase n=1 Tax=Anaerobacillus sp. MEB173 TaxID=3383345 RepID=UPI003F8F84C3